MKHVTYRVMTYGVSFDCRNCGKIGQIAGSNGETAELIETAARFEREHADCPKAEEPAEDGA